MGIPTFFRKIINQYPNTHYWNENEYISHLFIDFNCLIYQAHYQLSQGGDRNGNSLKNNLNYEKKLIIQVIKYLEKIVNEIVKPSQLVYLAFDGPPPRAKMIDQRRRRYKAIKREQYQDELNIKYNEKPIESWDTINITPGTRFMTNLSEELWKHIEKGKFKPEIVVLSDANVPGEGEHKFMGYIRKEKPKGNADEKLCIYGLDADLIVLSLTADRSDIIILREAQDSPIEMEKYAKIGYLYLSPTEYVKSLFDNLGYNIAANGTVNGRYELQRLLYDYTFLTFLAGNDFVRRITFLKIKDKRGGGLDILLGIYQKLLKEFKEYLVYPHGRVNRNGGTPQVNHAFLTRIMDELAKIEEQQLRDMQRGRSNQLTSDQKRFLEKENTMDSISLDMEKFEHSYYFNPMNPYFNKYGPKFKSIDFFQPKDVWRKQYYREFFDVSTEEIKYINMICQEYMDSLLFTLQYYLTNLPPDWNMFYPFGSAPLASDLSLYLRSKSQANLDKIIFKQHAPLDPFNQMMLIIPPQKGNIVLPQKYVELMTDVDSQIIPYYPIDFQLDALQGGKFIWAEPILPIIDNNNIKPLISEIKLTPEEKKRNQIKGKPQVYTVGKKSCKNDKKKLESKNVMKNDKKKQKSKNVMKNDKKKQKPKNVMKKK